MGSKRLPGNLSGPCPNCMSCLQGSHVTLGELPGMPAHEKQKAAWWVTYQDPAPTACFVFQESGTDLT